MLNIAVLISGSGRTLDNFHERIENGSLNCRIQVVVSNVDGVLGLEKAKNYGYPNFVAKDSAATNAVASILNEVVRSHADDQPGVHLTTDTFPRHRNV